MSVNWIDFSNGAPSEGDLNVSWDHGAPNKRGAPIHLPLQVHRCDPHTFIMRQNMTVHHEAPFIYLFCGNRRAMLIDTGATEEPERMPLREVVDRILEGWLADHPRAGYELVVAHTHGHSDHIAGDPQFQGRADTEIVEATADAAAGYFGIHPWPHGVGAIDLGGRVIEVTGIPGHHDSSVAYFDPWSGFLVTGDSAYPGRLYARDIDEFCTSLDHLVDFARGRPVTNVMGGHIEMARTPRQDHPPGARYQPDEPPLQMTIDQLRRIREAAWSVVDRPGVHRFDDFVVVHGSAFQIIPKYLARLVAHRFGRLLSKRSGVPEDSGSR